MSGGAGTPPGPGEGCIGLFFGRLRGPGDWLSFKEELSLDYTIAAKFIISALFIQIRRLRGRAAECATDTSQKMPLYSDLRPLFLKFRVEDVVRHSLCG